MFIFFFVTRQPWFVPLTDPGDKDNFYSYQGACLFWISVYQYITCAFIYSKSYPYRKPIFTNRPLLASLLTMTGISIWWTLYPPQAIKDWLNLLMPPFLEFRALIIILAAIGFLICYLMEHYVVDWLLITRRTNGRAASGGWGGAEVRKFAAILGDVGHSPLWLQQILQRKRHRGGAMAGHRRPPTNLTTSGGSSTNSANGEKCPFFQAEEHGLTTAF